MAIVTWLNEAVQLLPEKYAPLALVVSVTTVGPCDGAGMLLASWSCTTNGPRHPFTTPPLAATLKHWVPKREYAPGSTPAYSNYATALAGYIVEFLGG